MDRRLATVIATEVGTGALFGFGSWQHQMIEVPPSALKVIRVPWFGVDRRFQGATNAAGRKCADDLFATLEAVARAQPGSTPEMPVELYCDSRNARGLRFWARQGFRPTGTVETRTGTLIRLMR